MIIVVMGVSGCGKSTIAESLADALGWSFQEGDALHPQANIDKMSACTPLDDTDRWPWLDRIAAWIKEEIAHGRQGVVTCSALKRSYRDCLRLAGANVRFAYIQVSRDELERRLSHRLHFMPASLLESQLQTLEVPDENEQAITLFGADSIDTMIAEVCRLIDVPRLK